MPWRKHSKEMEYSVRGLPTEIRWVGRHTERVTGEKEAKRSKPGRDLGANVQPGGGTACAKALSPVRARQGSGCSWSRVSKGRNSSS